MFKLTAHIYFRDKTFPAITALFLSILIFQLCVVVSPRKTIIQRVLYIFIRSVCNKFPYNIIYNNIVVLRDYWLRKCNKYTLEIVHVPWIFGANMFFFGQPRCAIFYEQISNAHVECSVYGLTRA